MREKDIEKYLKEKVEKLGGLCLKWVSPGTTGVPDRILILPEGITIFVELKTDIGQLSDRQKVMIQKILGRKGRVYVVNSKEEVDTLITILYLTITLEAHKRKQNEII